MSAIKADILTFLEQNEILALSTTDGKHPYACNLHYSSDEEFNLYFMSNRRRQHVTNLSKDAEVAVCIYDPHAYDDKVVKGLQMRGVCKELNIEEDMDEIKKYYQKFEGKFSDENHEALQNVDFRVFFKITPKRIRMIDGKAWEYPREITLPEKVNQ